MVPYGYKLLLQPRKFKRKSFQKKRNFKTWTPCYLSYGTAGIRFQQSLRLSAKQIYRAKLFIKKAARAADKTQRSVWFSAFPHIPLTRKGKGSRMGKGAGKLSTWCIQLKPGVVLIEFRQLNLGRILYFYRQVSYKAPVKVQLLLFKVGCVYVSHTARANVTLLPFH